MIRPATPASLAAAVRGRLEAELPGINRKDGSAPRLGVHIRETRLAHLLN
jgi:hypothetical protein